MADFEDLDDRCACGDVDLEAEDTVVLGLQAHAAVACLRRP